MWCSSEIEISHVANEKIMICVYFFRFAGAGRNKGRDVLQLSIIEVH